MARLRLGRQQLHAAGENHALALRADLIPAQVARLDQDNVLTGKLGIKRTAATNALEVEGHARIRQLTLYSARMMVMMSFW